MPDEKYGPGDWGPGGEVRGGTAVTVHETQTHKALIEDIATAQPTSVPATPDAAGARQRDPTTGQYKSTKVVRENWGSPSGEIAPAGEEVIPGVGVGASLAAKMQGMPGGFETNYGNMLESLLDAGDACDDPKAVVAVWDASPGSLQTKICNDFLMYPLSDNEARYKRVYSKATLTEAAALDRLMRQAKTRK